MSNSAGTKFFNQFLFSRKLFALIFSKEYIKNNFYLQENDFYLPLLGNKLLQFYLQKYFNLFSFKRSDL